jgi:hypothetical protein
MTHGKLSIGAVLLVAGLAGACSSSKSGTTGAAGTSGAAGTGAAGTGAAGTAGTGAAGTGAAGTGTAGTGAAGVGATPTELVSAPGCGNLRLVLSSGTIYYTNHAAGTVSSIAVTGGTPKVIAMGQSKPNPIAVDATTVFWGNDGDKTVMKQTIAAGTASAILPASTAADPMNLNFANALLVDGATLYVGRGYDAYKIPTAGGTAVQLSHSPDADLGLPGAFALDPTHLYQVEISHNAVSRETIDGLQNGLLETGTAQALAPDRIAVSRAGLVTDAIAISGQYVVWANLDGIEIHDKDKTEQQSTLSLIVNSAGFNPISGFIISGNKIYYGETSDNNVQVAPLSFTVGDAGVPEGTVIATKQTNAAEFAADDTNIYFTTITTSDTTGVCKIMKLAK